MKEVHERDQNHESVEDADRHASEDVPRVVLVVGDASECDIACQTEDAELQKWTQDLEAGEHHFKHPHGLVLAIAKVVGAHPSQPRLDVDNEKGSGVEGEARVAGE